MAKAYMTPLAFVLFFIIITETSLASRLLQPNELSSKWHHPKNVDEQSKWHHPVAKEQHNCHHTTKKE